MDGTKIEWTDATWNPLRGCSRVSEGCRNCYAERVAARFSGWEKPKVGVAAFAMPFHGLAEMTPQGPRWTGKVRLVEENLHTPLHWRRPRRVFVNSMSDLFHENVPDEWIDRIFSVMARSKHTFQVLTKRAERMRAYLGDGTYDSHRRIQVWNAGVRMFGKPVPPMTWPLPNVWLGVSVEDQANASKRIPLLLETPAAVRWISAEPLLGPLTLDEFWLHGPSYSGTNRLGWVVVGGESGPGARPFDLAWARDLVDQCREAAVPIFVKQLGALPFDGKRWPDHKDRVYMALDSKKGGDMSEWPEDLRVREFPRQAVAA